MAKFGKRTRAAREAFAGKEDVTVKAKHVILATGARARTSEIPSGAAASSRGNSGSNRSYSLRKCPLLTIRPDPSWICSMVRPVRRIAFPA